MFYYITHGLIPLFIRENLEITIFFGTLTYMLFFMNWVVNTNWEDKFNWVSIILGTTGLFYLHYSNISLLIKYEVIFTTIWFVLFFYHASTWISNYNLVMTESTMTSLKRRKESSLFRYFITIPTSKNAAGHWNEPPFRNFIHFALVFVYGALLVLHSVAFVLPTTYECIGASSPLCCTYNFVMEGFNQHEVNKNFCSGKVNIAFAGSWSTGKTYVINSILGHDYATSQSAPAPTTDKFTCITLGAPYNDPIHSDDYEQRQHCEIMSHINDVTHKQCDEQLTNILDVADTNKEFESFVFYDMPGYQREYGKDCAYKTYYQKLIDMVDFIYVVWDVNHGKIEGEFADYFKNKARGTGFEIIYNRYKEDAADMGFLNQQYAQLSSGVEILSEMYTIKVHENNTEYETQFQEDMQLLRAKIKSVNQTVHDNRKKMMKSNLRKYQNHVTGIFSLYKFKTSEKLIEEDLNLHAPPKNSLDLLSIFFGYLNILQQQVQEYFHTHFTDEQKS